jgi:subtilisin family serine protease
MSKKNIGLFNASLIAAILAASGCRNGMTAPTTPAVSMQPSAASPARQSGKARDVIDGRYIVVFRDGPGDVDALARELSTRAKGQLRHTFRNGITGFAAAMTAEAAFEVSNDPRVAYVEQDAVVALEVDAGTEETAAPTAPGPKLEPRRSVKSWASWNTTSTVTSLTERNAYWNLDRIDQSAGGLDNSYTYNATGAGVNVYIIDSGIRVTHREFGGRATADFSEFDDGHDADGCYWHGTHVAGIVGGALYGAAKNVNLHSVRAFDCGGSSSTSELLIAIEWVMTNGVRPTVMNMSFRDDLSAAMNDAISRAFQSGIVIVAAAGNSASDACDSSPQSAPEVITVAASDDLDNLAPYSNFGSCVDIIAPGQAKSAFNVDDVTVVDANGTSMAAPLVAGAAAMYLEIHPGATPAMVSAALIARASADLIANVPKGTPNLLLRIPYGSVK